MGVECGSIRICKWQRLDNKIILQDESQKQQQKQWEGQAQSAFCDVVSTSSREADSNIISYPESEDEEVEIIFLGHVETTMIAITRPGNPYHKLYEQATSPSQPPPPKAIKQPTGPVMRKAIDKERESNLRHAQLLNKDHIKGSLRSFRFDILAQLANIPTRITLYKLLKLSTDIPEALREALVDADAFATHVRATQVRGKSKNLKISIAIIYFT